MNTLTLTSTLSQKWQSQHPNVKAVIIQPPNNPTDFIDYISWEHQADGVESNVSVFWFKSLYLLMGGYKPFHPTVRVLCFQKVVFGPGVYLTHCAQLQEIWFSACMGELEIIDNSLNQITVCGDECFKLSNSSVKFVHNSDCTINCFRLKYFPSQMSSTEKIEANSSFNSFLEEKINQNEKFTAEKLNQMEEKINVVQKQVQFLVSTLMKMLNQDVVE
ncbi:Hypothetical_protein [Hexamita inflata]|uniref:Hypothetical_protein n=1 Tax=Hexamita inflata TaxID=28002 RepID=A0ABP1GUR9_9EUKA